MGKAALLAASLLALAGCAGGPAGARGAKPPGETIAWSIGPCFGFCPVYTASVAPGGTVTFNGERNTALLGTRSREGGAETYRAIAATLAPFRPTTGTTAQTSCDQQISDQAHVRINWTAPDGTATVLEHDGGCRSPANDALNAALRTLPVQAGIAPWAQQTTRPGASRG